jgi:sulfate transport system substrate-binding protein
MRADLTRTVTARRGILTAALLGVLALMLGVAAGCGGGDEASASGGDGGTLSLVAYSTPREAYEELIPMFQDTATGAGAEFEQSYAASGEQRTAIEEGLPADFFHASLEPDVAALAEAGMVAADWDQNEYGGILTNSVVVFAVRPGNPESIQTWDDLLEEGVEVITPNPFTSGGAQWNIMAAYGAQLEQGKSDEEAIAYLKELFLEHVPVQDKSAREALQTFASGKGDVMLAYENEAIFAQQAGQELDYVVPEQTILIENPAAVVNTGESSETAQAFLDFLYTPEAQAVFASKGYRPVVEGVETPFDSSGPAGIFTVEDLGGWSDVRERFFDREESIFLDIENELGVPTDD